MSLEKMLMEKITRLDFVGQRQPVSKFRANHCKVMHFWTKIIPIMQHWVLKQRLQFKKDLGDIVASSLKMSAQSAATTKKAKENVQAY